MRPPVFFLSSTIHDFRDLRSAIKYFLEQRGCSVLASEFNDFRKSLDLDNFQACLQSIENCDYYVLLIGSRVGAWYDTEKRISITQQEYRTAYALHAAGKLRIVILVRREIWDLKDNHHALADHLRTLELDAETARQVLRYPTRCADDAEFVIRFVEEVGRTVQSDSGPVLPTGNWIHVFDGFRDVADLLTPVVAGGLPVEEAIFRRALRHELNELLGYCLLKIDGRPPMGPRPYVERFNREFRLTRDHDVDGDVTVPTRAWDNFSTVMMGLLGRRFRTFILPQSLTSPTFLDFDPATGSVRESDVFKALHRLGEEVRRAAEATDGDAFGSIFAYSPRARGGYSPPSVQIPFAGIASLIGLSFRWVNMVELASAVLAHLDGDRFVMPPLLPWSPIQGMDEILGREQATTEEVTTFVRCWREAHEVSSVR